MSRRKWTPLFAAYKTCLVDQWSKDKIRCESQRLDVNPRITPPPDFTKIAVETHPSNEITKIAVETHRASFGQIDNMLL